MLLSLLSAGVVLNATLRADYTLRFDPKPDRTDVLVDLEVANAPQGAEWQVPRCYYGTPQIEQYMSELKGATQDGAKLKLNTAQNGAAKVSYRMSFPPSLASLTFSPVAGPKHFRSYFCQFMLRPADVNQEIDFTFTLEPPKDQPKTVAYTSLQADPKNAKITAPYSRLISVVGGWGDVHQKMVTVNGNPVQIILDKDFSIPAEEMLGTIERIVKYQRDWFKDDSFPYYLVSMAARPENVAGSGAFRSFVCFLRPEASRFDLLKILSHEMLHSWIPSKMMVTFPGDDIERWRWEWFDEGFTDYFSWVILKQSGAITQEQFAELVNTALVNLYQNPSMNITYANARRDMDEERFSVGHKKLSYYRGSLIAAEWDRQLRDSGPGARLEQVMRKLYEESIPRKGWVTEAEFYAHFKPFGIDAKEWQERHIVQGEPIPIHPGLLGTGYELELVDIPSFDLGFATEKGKITAVTPGSPAEKAGLKAGMTVVSQRNTNRFGNAFEISKPVRITAAREDGTTLEAVYMPHGPIQKIPQFLPR